MAMWEYQVLNPANFFPPTFYIAAVASSFWFVVAKAYLRNKLLFRLIYQLSYLDPCLEDNTI